MKGEKGYSESNATRPEWLVAERKVLQQDMEMRDYSLLS